MNTHNRRKEAVTNSVTCLRKSTSNIRLVRFVREESIRGKRRLQLGSRDISEKVPSPEYIVNINLPSSSTTAPDPKPFFFPVLNEQ